MRSVEDTRPRSGLSVPVLTVLDAEGGLIEADQRALVRYVVQDGYGADVVFSAGTTGEWDRLDNRVRQQVTRLSVCAGAPVLVGGRGAVAEHSAHVVGDNGNVVGGLVDAH